MYNKRRKKSMWNDKGLWIGVVIYILMMWFVFYYTQ